MGIARRIRGWLAAFRRRGEVRRARERSPGGRPGGAPDRACREEDLPGAVVVTDTLDLHGFFPEQIAEVIDAFLERAVELHLERVRIIHGKGRSVLKREVWNALESDRRVVDFRDAPPELGGWGATIALIGPAARTTNSRRR